MDRDYKIILAATGLNTTVTAMLYATLQLMAFELTGDLMYVGLISSLPYLGLMLMAYVWGLISDYLGQRKLLVIVSGIIGSSLFFVYPFVSGIEAIIAIRFVQVCLMGSVILLIAVATERHPGQKGKVIGELNIPLAFGWIIGAVTAAVLYELNPVMFFIVCGLVGFAASIVLIPMAEPKKDVGSIMSGGLKGMLSFKKKRPIGILCASTLFLLTGNYIIYSVFAQYLKSPMFGLTIMQIGFIIAGSGLFGMLVFRFAGNLVDRKGRRSVLLITLFTYMISWMVYALTTNLVVIVILWVLPYWSFFTTSSTAMVSDLTEEKERGRGIGILNAAINFGNFAGSLMGGFLAQRFGYANAYFIAALMVSVAFAIAFGTKETVIVTPDNPDAKNPGREKPSTR